MMIIDFAFKSLAEYLSDGKGYEVPRPEMCPLPLCRCPSGPTRGGINRHDLVLLSNGIYLNQQR